MGFIDLGSVEKKQLREGVLSQIVSGEKLMMAFMSLQPNLSDPGHSHPHEQCGIILDGELELTIGGEARILKKGDTYFIPGGLPHGARTFGKSCVALDIFSPPREEYR